MSRALTPAQTLVLRKIAVNRTWGIGGWKDARRPSRPVQLAKLKTRIASARALEKRGLIIISTQDPGTGWGNAGAAVTLTDAGLLEALK